MHKNYEFFCWEKNNNKYKQTKWKTNKRFFWRTLALWEGMRDRRKDKTVSGAETARTVLKLLKEENLFLCWNGLGECSVTEQLDFWSTSKLYQSDKHSTFLTFLHVFSFSGALVINYSISNQIVAKNFRFSRELTIACWDTSFHRGNWASVLFVCCFLFLSDSVVPFELQAPEWRIDKKT